MSVEKIRQIIAKRFTEWDELPYEQKYFENLRSPVIPKDGFSAFLEIEIVKHDIVSIGSKPCTRMTGVIAVSLLGHIGIGTSGFYKLADSLSEWMSLYSEDGLQTKVGRNSFRGEDKSKTYYKTIVYIPFIYN